MNIIAVDFDGTLCKDKYPKIGEPNELVMEYIKDEQRKGAKIILWTCRTGKELEEAIFWCFSHDLCFDTINENIPEIVEAFGSDVRKVFANEYVDDHGKDLDFLLWECACAKAYKEHQKFKDWEEAKA